MKAINIENFCDNIFDYINQAIEFDDVIKVCTERGNVVVLSEEDYNGLIATIELSDNLYMKSEIIEGTATPIEDCITEENVGW